MQVADAAFFTFKLTMEERTKDNDILKDDKKAAEMMEKIKKEVISVGQNGGRVLIVAKISSKLFFLEVQ